MATYNVNIENGSGTANILTGQYTVTSNTNGYDNTSIDPSTLNITSDVSEYTLKIAATGTLTLHVSEEGTASGTAVQGATFVRCDSSGNEYGTPVTSDSSGNAILESVPFSATEAPIIYYKQTASDGAHEFVSTLQNTTLTSQTATVEITNALPTTKTIKLTDANYEGLAIEKGTINLA